MNVKAIKPIYYQKNASTLVTMKDVEEVRLRLKKQNTIESPPSPPSSMLSLSPSSFSLPAPNIEKSHWRTGLILALNEHLSKRDGLIRDAMDEFCKKYNSGSLLPNIYKKIGPVSIKTLYRFKQYFEECGVDALIPRYGGVGKSKVTDHEKNFLLTLLLHQNRLKIGFAIRLMKNRFKEIGLESPSSADTLRRFIDQFKNDHYDLWILMREGEKALDDKVLPYIERDRTLLEVGDVLVGDGHRLNLQAINPHTGQQCRPTIVAFLDWRSNYLLGWEIMLEENVQCIASAARNAILTLGKIPKVIYFDNSRAFRARFFTSNIDLADGEIAGMFYRLEGLKKVVFTQPYNAKAKIIERFFRTFTDWFERTWESYIGSSIDDKPAWTKRNERLARSLHSDRLPEISEINKALFKFREFYIDQPSRALGNQTPRDIFNAGKGPGVDPFKLFHLMMERKITNIHRNGFTLFGCNWYDENLYNYRDQAIIKYSLFDLSQIYIFNMKNDFLCAAKPVLKTHPMASVLGTPKDIEEVKRQIAHKRSLKKQVLKIDRLFGQKASEMLPWKEIVQEVPNMVEALEKIESEKPAMKPISPFVDDSIEGDFCIAQISERNEEEKPKYKFPKDWSHFTGDHWERYDYHMAQEPEALIQEDLDFIEWYKTTTEYQAIYCPKVNSIRGEL